MQSALTLGDHHVLTCSPVGGVPPCLVLSPSQIKFSPQPQGLFEDPACMRLFWRQLRDWGCLVGAGPHLLLCITTQPSLPPCRSTLVWGRYPAEGLQSSLLPDWARSAMPARGGRAPTGSLEKWERQDAVPDHTGPGRWHRGHRPRITEGRCPPRGSLGTIFTPQLACPPAARSQGGASGHRQAETVASSSPALSPPLSGRGGAALQALGTRPEASPGPGGPCLPPAPEWLRGGQGPQIPGEQRRGGGSSCSPASSA